MHVRILLLPFSLLYGAIVWIRNGLFDVGLLRERRYERPVICIGNIKVGGTGKSPFTEYLVQLLKDRWQVATLSRGYGRRTKGLLMAGFPADANLVGDEAAQFKNKFPDVPVCVSENRRLGIDTLFALGAGVVLMDDAYQHRWVKAGLNMVLMEYKEVYRLHLLLPAGDYRESLRGLKRADMLIVTKVPASHHIDQEQRMKIRHRLRLNSRQKLFFSCIRYGELQPLYRLTENDSGGSSMGVSLNATRCMSLGKVREVFLLTGIANPSPLLRYLESFKIQTRHFSYADHHHFTLREIKALLEKFREVLEADTMAAAGTIILCTEKDAQRLKGLEFKLLLSDYPFYYIPIFSDIIDQDKREFENYIYEYVKSGV